MTGPGKKYIYRIAVGAFLLSAALPLGAGVYYWTDENGVRHYSNVTPSESGSEIQRLDEIPPGEAKDRLPDDMGKTGTREPAALESPSSQQASPPAGPETAEEASPGAATEAEPAPQRVPTEQNEIVQSEKSLVRELQRQLEQDASRRDEIITKERDRLARAIEQLQKTPASEFGSQKNKTRALGYYRYRLEALLDSPDGYFAYGDSDID